MNDSTLAPRPARQGLDSNNYYAATARPGPVCTALEGETTADVCVIGGGYTGLSAALHLAERGYRVVLLEAGRIGQGASGRNGGQVCVGQNQDQGSLERMLGPTHARALWELSLEAVALVRNLILQHRIDCDLKSGILHTAFKASHLEPMQRAVEKLQRDYGYEGVRFVPRAELEPMLGTDRYHGAQLFSDALHLHPLNYALGLATAAVARGVRIHESSRVLRYQTGPAPRIETAGGTVRAEYVVLACNAYLGQLEPRIAGKIMPINNFILATEALDEGTARALIRDDVAVADSRFVVNYFRLSADRRLLFGGGENYSNRFPGNIADFVRRHLLEVYPQLAGTGIDYAWGGALAITLNRLPFFRRLDPSLFVAQGYSGHGIALATLGGKLIAEAVSGSAERFDVMAAIPTPTFPGGTLLRWPMLVTGMLYYSLRDRF